MENKQPLVSVNVLMYNSSKYIVETLESIRAQTYKNIELIISDDKSTDNTVDICEEWVYKNKSRFANVKILVPEHNTGQSGNYNRAFRAAEGEWIKEIDGDDLLLPNCIEDCVCYVQENPDAKYVFGKMTYFGGAEEENKKVEKWLDNGFFRLSPKEQLYQLIWEGNHVPSPSSFYSKPYMLELGFECDERIPNFEDYPKWIVLLQKGVRFLEIPKPIVNYRVGSGISTGARVGLRYYRNQCLCDMYYRYPEWQIKNSEAAIIRLVDSQCNIYKQLLSTEEELRKLQNNPIVKILRRIKHLIK